MLLSKIAPLQSLIITGYCLFLCAVYGFSQTSYNISEMGRLSVPFAGTVKGMTEFDEDLEGSITSTAGGTASMLLFDPDTLLGIYYIVFSI